MTTGATFPRELDALPGVFKLAEAFAAGNGLGERPRFLVDFVLEELFTNLVRHNPAATGAIDIELDLAGAELMILVRDSDCARFDLRTDAPVVDPNLPLAGRRPGGLGIYLVKSMVDRIEYGHQDRVGTIRLFKRLE